MKRWKQALALAVLALAIFFGHSFLSEKFCSVRAGAYQYQYSIELGCLVEIGGKWVSFDELRR